MQIINQDILSVRGGVICHQVNCMGVMGTGIAKAIRNKWPKVYNEYRQLYTAGKLVLGSMHLVLVHEDIFDGNTYVANLAGQYYYGRDRRYTDYGAVRTCLKALCDASHRRPELSIYIPYNMGCANAGGDWKVVSQIIDEELPHAIICKKG